MYELKCPPMRGCVLASTRGKGELREPATLAGFEHPFEPLHRTDEAMFCLRLNAGFLPHALEVPFTLGFYRPTSRLVERPGDVVSAIFAALGRTRVAIAQAPTSPASAPAPAVSHLSPTRRERASRCT